MTVDFFREGVLQQHCDSNNMLKDDTAKQHSLEGVYSTNISMPELIECASFMYQYPSIRTLTLHLQRKK